MAMTHGKASTYNTGCRCKPCTMARLVYTRTYRSTPKGKEASNRAGRKSARKKNGILITDADCLKILETQNNKCAICEKRIKYPDGRNIALDHNHSTGKIRGLLCQRCNRLLGRIENNLKLIPKFLTYLKETNHGTLSRL